MSRTNSTGTAYGSLNETRTETLSAAGPATNAPVPSQGGTDAGDHLLLRVPRACGRTSVTTGPATRMTTASTVKASTETIISLFEDVQRPWPTPVSSGFLVHSQLPLDAAQYSKSILQPNNSVECEPPPTDLQSTTHL